jgi:transposase
MAIRKKKNETNNQPVLTRQHEGPLTIGIDLGDRVSHYCILTADGDVLMEGRLQSTPAAFRAQFASFPATLVALEVGTHSRWVSSLLADIGHKVVVANASQVHLIHKSSRKTDKVDARTLAKLARLDRTLLSPVQHRTNKAQANLCLIRARQALVASRTQLINCVRGIVKSFGERLPRCSSESFFGKTTALIPDILRPALDPLQKQIAILSAQIQAYEKQIVEIADKHFPETRALRSVPGVGAITALSFVLTLEEPDRFRKSRDVGSYLGLVPEQSQSGASSPQLGISKAGDSYLRKLLVGSAQYILGPLGPDTGLRRWGCELSKRGGPNAKKRAVVAVARKLAVLLHRLWVDQAEDQPFRSTAVEQTAA